MLKISGIAESDECHFCFTETKSAAHLFRYCYVVSAFWRVVQKMCNAMKLCQIICYLLHDQMFPLCCCVVVARLFLGA